MGLSLQDEFVDLRLDAARQCSVDGVVYRNMDKIVDDFGVEAVSAGLLRAEATAKKAPDKFSETDDTGVFD